MDNNATPGYVTDPLQRSVLSRDPHGYYQPAFSAFYYQVLEKWQQIDSHLCYAIVNKERQRP